MGCCDCNREALLEGSGFAVCLCEDFNRPVGVEGVEVVEQRYEHF